MLPLLDPHEYCEGKVSCHEGYIRHFNKGGSWECGLFRHRLRKPAGSFENTLVIRIVL